MSKQDASLTHFLLLHLKTLIRLRVKGLPRNNVMFEEVFEIKRKITGTFTV